MRVVIKSRFKLTLLALVLAGGLGCNTKKVPRVTHKPVSDEAQVYQSEQEVVQDIQILADSQQNYVEILESKNSQDIFERVVKPLQEKVLNPNVMANLQVSNTSRFSSLLQTLNEAIILVAKKDLRTLIESGTLEKYLSVALYDCQMGGACPNLRIFARDHRSKKVLLLAAREEKDVQKYYSYLYAAFDMVGSVMDPELEFAFLKRAKEYAQQSTSLEHKSNSSDPDYQRLKKVFQNILQSYEPQDPNSTSFKQFIANFNPWRFSKNDKDLFSESSETILFLAAKYHMYGDGGEVTPEFKLAIQEVLEGRVRDSLKLIYNSPSRPILNSLLNGLSFEANEYLYIIDKLFHEDITIDGASSLWMNTKKNEMKFIQVLNQYLRVQVAKMVVVTNNKMNQFFLNARKYTSTFELLRHAVSETLELYNSWDSMQTRVGFLNTLVDRHIKKFDTYSRHTEESQLVKKTLLNFTSLRNNVKFLSVYPNMMMLIYLMAKENFKETIKTFWGNFTVDSAKIINAFFKGEMAPWYNFGTDDKPLNSVELLYSFHFALITETFTTFATNSVIPVTEADFLRAIIKKYLLGEMNKLEESIRRVQEYGTKNKSIAMRMSHVCKEEEVKQVGERTQIQAFAQNIGSGNLIESLPSVLVPREELHQVNWDEMEKYTFNGASGTANTFWRYFDDLYSVSNREQLKNIRTELSSKVNYLKNMANMLRSYYRSQNRSVDDLDKVIVEEFRHVENLQREYTRLLYNLHKETGDCVYLFVNREFDLQHALIAKERKFLEGVYDDLVKVSQGEELSAVAKKYVLTKSGYQGLETISSKITDDVMSSLPEDFFGSQRFDRFQAGGFYYSQMYFLTRMSSYMNDLVKHINVTLPSLERQRYYHSPEPKLIPFVSAQSTSKETFVATGLREMANHLDWYDGSTALSYLENRLEMVIEFYKVRGASLDHMGFCKSGESACVNVSAEDIYREAKQSLDIIHLDPYEIEALNFLGDVRKYRDEFLQGWFIEKETLNKLAPFDLVLQRVLSDKDVHNKESVEFLEEAKEYYAAEIGLGQFLFQPQGNIKEILRKSHKEQLAKYKRDVEEFIAAVERMSVKESSPMERLIFGLSPNDQIHVGGKYLSESRKSRYRSLLREFNDSTDRVFEE